jgi:hypothetical protein
VRLLSSSRLRWYLLAGLWIALLVLGTGGFVQQAHDAHLSRSTLDTLYLTAQLATLDYQGGDEALNWRLQIARFVAPMMAATTLLQTASVVFRDQFARARLRFFRNHVIVCGLGGAGSRLAIALSRAGHDVVGVEKDASASGVEALRAQNVVVVVGDATDRDVLRAARLGRAARAVALCGTDATNVAVASAVRGAIGRRTIGTALRCSVHLTDAELTVLLRAGELTGAGSTRVDFFNLHERAARAWLGEHPPFGDGSRPPHLVVLGLGQLGRSLVVAAAQRWCDQGEGPLRITMVDRSATGRWHALRLQHPALAEVVDASTLDIDLEAPTAAGARLFSAVLDESSATSVAVAFEDESLALSTALLVHQVLRSPGVPIVVRTNADSGLGALVTPDDGSTRAPFPGLAVFPFLDKACTPAIVEGGLREQLARAIHEDYLGRAGAGEGLRRPWDELDDEQRESSRRAADGIIDGMDEIGFDLVPLRRWGGDDIAFESSALERLARREHERWMTERAAAGWTHGEVRDDQRKQNPLLVPWDELAEPAKESNRQAAQALPSMLARAGFEPVPR